MQLACNCDAQLGIAPGVIEAGVQVITSLVTGALARSAHARAKKQAWEDALQRIPEDNFVDYAAYVKDTPDLEKAWRGGTWHPGRGATRSEFGLIHIREFGPRKNVKIKALKPGKRPAPGPVSPGAISWPVQVLRKLPPLANPVPTVRGINDMTEAQRRQLERLENLRAREQYAAAYGDRPPVPQQSAGTFSIAGLEISPLTLILGGVVAYLLFNRGGE